MPDTADRTTAIYDAIAAFQRTHRLPGLQHAQIRGLLAEHLARVLPAEPAVSPPADDQTERPHGCDTSTCPCLACEADQTERRDRYAAAIRDQVRFRFGASVLALAQQGRPIKMTIGEAETAADAVMVVADAEQAELRTENARMRHELEVMYGGAFDMPPTAAPAVDRTDLRDRIAEAIHGDLLAHAARRDQGLLGIVPRLTDAVLAVLPEPADRGAVLLRDAESYLSALHGSVARHDNLAANLGCAGCELRDQIRDELRRMADEAQQPGSPS